MNGNCIKCEGEFPVNELSRYDEVLNMGLCSGCNEVKDYSKMSKRTQEQIRRYGTPDEVRLLDEQLASEVKEEKPVVYEKRFAKVSEMIPKVNYRPSVITYEKSAAVFWFFYKQIVYKETGKKIDENSFDGNMKDICSAFVKYCIGVKNDLFDMRKSVLLWGSYGVGKSTIVLAGYMMMKHIAQTTKWNDRGFKMISLSELFFRSRNESDLTEYNKIIEGNYCFDEMKEDQFKIKHYGSEIKIIGSLFEMRHNKWKMNNTRTIITSNVAPSEMEDLLGGDKVLMSRIKQEYCAIELKGKNKR